MKTTHTPGPWAHYDGIIYIEKVGTVAEISDDLTAKEANARLIAAAPDLLNACLEAMELLKNGDAEPCDADFVTAILIEAIRKASA